MKPVLALMLSVSVAAAQNLNMEYDKFPMGDSKTIISGIAMSPDNQYIAAGCIQGFPLHIYDWKSRNTVKKIDVKGYYAGPKVTYSAGGNYLLLQQQFYNDRKLNKDRKTNFMVIDIQRGEALYEIDNLHDAVISADEKYLVTVGNEGVEIRNLLSREILQTFKVENVANAVAISPDGSKIAVAHLPDKKLLANVPSVRNQKKAMKSALKYRQMVSVYDAQTFKKLYTVNDVYDIIYKLRFTTGGTSLLCYSIPHTKLQTSTAGRQGYINKINAADGESLRTSFLSLSTMEPDVKLNDEENMIGVISVNDKGTPSLNIYDFISGTMLYSFDLKTRLGAAFKSGEFGGFWSFEFLPGNEQVLIASGNRLIIWNIK